MHVEKQSWNRYQFIGNNLPHESSLKECTDEEIKYLVLSHFMNEKPVAWQVYEKKLSSANPKQNRILRISSELKEEVEGIQCVVQRIFDEILEHGRFSECFIERSYQMGFAHSIMCSAVKKGCPDIALSVLKGEESQVKAFLNRESKNKTVLHVAAESNNVQCLAKVLDVLKSYELFNAQMKAQTNLLETPLFLALRSGDGACVSRLIEESKLLGKEESQIFLKAQNHLEQSCLHVICQTGNIEMLQIWESAIKEHGWTLSDFQVKDKNGYLPTHFVCSSGNLEYLASWVEILKEQERLEEAMQEKGGKGYFPLHFVCLSGNVDCLRFWAGLLDEYGLLQTQLQAKDANSYLPLHFAYRSGNTECFEELLSLLEARELLEAQLKGNVTEEDSVLHFVCKQAKTSCFRILIDALNKFKLIQVLLKSKDYLGYTPFRKAIVSGKKELVLQFLRAGASYVFDQKSKRYRLGYTLLSPKESLFLHLAILTWASLKYVKSGYA